MEDHDRGIRMGRTLWLAFVLMEVLGIIVGSVGLGVALAMHADWAFILITAGAVLGGSGAGLFAKFLRRPPGP